MEISEEEPIIDNLILDDYIAGQPSIDGSIVYPRYGIDDRSREHEKVDKSEKYGVLNAKTVFAIIFFTNIATLIVSPSWLTFTLPLSIAVSFLISSLSKLSRMGKEEDYECKKIRGDEDW